MDLLFILAIAFFGLLVGIVAATLLLGIRGIFARDNPLPPQPEEMPTEPAPAFFPERVEVVRLLRQNNRAGLLVELDGRVLHGPGDLDAEQRERLEQAWEELSGWVAPAPAPPDTAQVDRQDEPVPPADLSLPPDEQLPTAPPPPALGYGTGPLDPLLPGQSRFLSLAGQIDYILQEQLTARPPDAPPIRLLDSPRGGLLVQVGSEQYEGIEAVPEELVRSAIRSAVQEWEKRAVLKP